MDEELRIRESLEKEYGKFESFDSVAECFAYLNSLGDEDEEED